MEIVADVMVVVSGACGGSVGWNLRLSLDGLGSKGGRFGAVLGGSWCGEDRGNECVRAGKGWWKLQEAWREKGRYHHPRLGELAGLESLHAWG